MAIQESGEMYLETILILLQTKGYVRSIDISREMNFSKPSVSRAVGLLKEEGYITVNERGYIDLTDSGRQIAETIYERHEVISKLLIALGVSQETAVADACRMEHVISAESFAALKEHGLKMMAKM